MNKSYSMSGALSQCWNVAEKNVSTKTHVSHPFPYVWNDIGNPLASTFWNGWKWCKCDTDRDIFQQTIDCEKEHPFYTKQFLLKYIDCTWFPSFVSVIVLWNYQFSRRKPCVFRQDALPGRRIPPIPIWIMKWWNWELPLKVYRFLLTSGKGRFSSQVWHAWYQKKELVAEGSPLNNQRFCPMVGDFFDSQRKFSWETSDIRTTSQ